MPDPDRGEATLPSLREYAAVYRPRKKFYLSIIFHPDCSRIGERATLGLARGSEAVVGRHGPRFDAGSGAALGDPYVSRRALSIRAVPGGLLLQRPANASACRVAGEELQGEHRLSSASLESGVPLMLSHSIVLLLHSGEPGANAGQLSDCGLVGRSLPLQQLRAQILLAAGSDRDVLLRGETGTGKELVASAIHRAGTRAEMPFIAVNMAAITPTLAAASLFGSARGAYTGAARAQPGYFQRAEGGTLFLDEIGDTPEEVQPLLLRALQQREIQCVGGALERVDLRVVSATDSPLDGPRGNFKSALRHRLGAMEIRLPTLREHAADIGELLCFFLRQSAEREGVPDPLPNADSEPRRVAAWAALFYAFSSYRWPGNVRQLANFAAQVQLASGGGLPQLPAVVRAAFSETGEGEGGPSAARGREPGKRRLREIGDDEFREVMQHCRYEVAAVAAALGVSRQSVYRRVHSSPDFRLVSQLDDDEVRRELRRHNGDIAAAAARLAVSESALRSRVRDSGQAG